MTAEEKLIAALDFHAEVQMEGRAVLATTPAHLLDPHLLAEAAAINATMAERLNDLLRQRAEREQAGRG